jgi:hypothetical protein
MPFVSCTTFNTSQAAQDAATTAAIAAATASPAICSAVVACITARPTGAPAVAGDLVIGADGQKHALPVAGGSQNLTIAGQTLSISGGNSVTLPDSDTQALSIAGNVLSLTNGGSVTLPASTVFATPAQTIAGASTTLSVNPADLVARENIPAQTGLNNDVALIPAPTASQSPWGQNALGETLHYAPGLGWKIIDNQYHTSCSVPSSAPVATVSNVIKTICTLAAPRAGLAVLTANVTTITTENQSQTGGISINGTLVRFDNAGAIGPQGPALANYSISSNNASVSWTGRVAATDILSSVALTLGTNGIAYGDFTLTYIGS